jgi:hypothetical protein
MSNDTSKVLTQDPKTISVFALSRTDIETMISQFVEAFPEDPIGEFKGLSPDDLIAFQAKNFGQQLKYMGSYQGVDYFDQV